MADQHKEAFKLEAKELLSELENTLLELEIDTNNKELIGKAFRALHTVKGSAGMFDYDNISMFSHDIETVFDYVRNDEIQVTKDLIDLTLMAKDQIILMLDESENKKLVDEDTIKKIIFSFKGYVAKLKSSESENAVTNLHEKVVEIKKLSLYMISFKPLKEIFINGTNPVFLLNELASFGNLCVKCDYSKIPDLGNLIPEFSYVEWKMLLLTTKSLDTIKDVFIFVEDLSEIDIEPIETPGLDLSVENFQFLSESYLKTESATPEDISNRINEIKKEETELKQLLVKEIKQDKKDIHKDIHQESDTTQSIRINADKLDELVNLVGELVIVQARLSQTVSYKDDAELSNIAEEVERLTWELRDSALNIRMLPIGTTFNKFKRLVRDLSNELGKEVDLTTDGADTELDKTVIEKLNDPLIHIIRNSIDHGVESPEKRVQSGKDKKGIVHLSASQSGGNVLIKISDDGAGIDKEGVKNKAIGLGLITEGVEYKDSEIYAFIFHPGFSMAKKITNVSGRGVGMDVVKKAIESLRGTVEVESILGKGTTITLKLPLTLAIIDGLLVQIASNFFVLPLSSVEECVELSREDSDKMHGRNIINIRGELIPFIKLRERFFITGEKPRIEQVVIADIKGTRVGFVVDKVVGQHQTVLKTLGRVFKSVNDISGATILGDGKVALIIDALKLAQQQEQEEKERLERHENT